MEIRPLDPARYAGWQFTARYVTGSYLDISPSESGFALTRRPIAPPAEKSFTDRLFGSWLERRRLSAPLTGSGWPPSARVRPKAGTTATASATCACWRKPTAAGAWAAR